MQITCFTLPELSQKFFLLSLELAQNAINQPFQHRTFNHNGTFHCLSQCGMRRDTRVKKLIEANHNQIMHGALLAGHWT